MKTTDLNSSEYNSYYGTYIELVGDVTLIDGLKKGLSETISFLTTIPVNKLEYRYAEGKWTIKEIVRHIIDTERIFAYRALRFARNDETSLPGFNQDEYIIPAKANSQNLDSLLEEYKANRLATLAMFVNFSDAMLKGYRRSE